MKTSKTLQYNTEIAYELEYYPLKDFIDLAHFSNAEQSYIACLTTTTTKNGFYNIKDVQKKEYIVSADELTTIQKNPEISHSISNKAHLYVVKSQFLHDFPLYGNNDSLYQLDHDKRFSYSDYFSKQPFTDIRQSPENYTLVELLPNDDHIRVFKDVKGQLYCEPFFLEYINARLDNERYHLDQLVEHLMTRNDIAFVANPEASTYSSRKQALLKCPLSENHPRLNEIIDDIPGYNSEPGRDETITIIYYPKEEDILKILLWKAQGVQDKNCYNTETFIVQHILNAQEFLVNKERQVENPAPKRKFKR